MLASKKKSTTGSWKLENPTMKLHKVKDSEFTFTGALALSYWIWNLLLKFQLPCFLVTKVYCFKDLYLSPVWRQSNEWEQFDIRAYSQMTQPRNCPGSLQGAAAAQKRLVGLLEAGATLTVTDTQKGWTDQDVWGHRCSATSDFLRKKCFSLSPDFSFPDWSNQWLSMMEWLSVDKRRATGVIYLASVKPVPHNIFLSKLEWMVDEDWLDCCSQSVEPMAQGPSVHQWQVASLGTSLI